LQQKCKFSRQFANHYSRVAAFVSIVYTMSRTIIAFLTWHPSKLFYDFCEKIKRKKYDIYIFIDHNGHTIPDTENDDEIHVIQLESKVCEDSGFKSTLLWRNNAACARDKALYYFCKNDIAYDYIWLIEEDVFIPSIDTIEKIDNKYTSGDLLVSDHRVIHQRETYWHWWHVNTQIQLEPPYAASMICAVRCSRKLMECIHEYAAKYNNLFLDEAMFNTISLHNHLEIRVIDELSTIVWRKEWKKEDIRPENLYHPIKSIETQYEYRIV
jgi:hypothetical protein